MKVDVHFLVSTLTDNMFHLEITIAKEVQRVNDWRTQFLIYQDRSHSSKNKLVTSDVKVANL
jgi:hypothetical protein